LKTQIANLAIDIFLYMTRYILPTLLILFIIEGNAQSIELNTLFNSSSEKRLDKARGLGILYSHNLTQKSALGLAFTFKSKQSNFDVIERSNANPTVQHYTTIISKSKSYSFRLNYQYSLIKREDISFSLGPEVSYNLFEVKDIKNFSTSANAGSYSIFKNEISNIRKYGLGGLVRIQIHNVLTKKLSLCFDIRPEILYGTAIDGGGKAYPFNGKLSNLEFMVGLQYHFINQ
jgi:hypothetical protein